MSAISRRTVDFRKQRTPSSSSYFYTAATGHHLRTTLLARYSPVFSYDVHNTVQNFRDSGPRQLYTMVQLAAALSLPVFGGAFASSLLDLSPPAKIFETPRQRRTGRVQEGNGIELDEFDPVPFLDSTPSDAFWTLRGRPLPRRGKEFLDDRCATQERDHVPRTPLSSALFALSPTTLGRLFPGFGVETSSEGGTPRTASSVSEHPSSESEGPHSQCSEDDAIASENKSGFEYPSALMLPERPLLRRSLLASPTSPGAFVELDPENKVTSAAAIPNRALPDCGGENVVERMWRDIEWYSQKSVSPVDISSFFRLAEGSVVVEGSFSQNNGSQVWRLRLVAPIFSQEVFPFPTTGRFVLKACSVLEKRVYGVYARTHVRHALRGVSRELEGRLFGNLPKEVQDIFERNLLLLPEVDHVFLAASNRAPPAFPAGKLLGRGSIRPGFFGTGFGEFVIFTDSCETICGSVCSSRILSSNLIVAHFCFRPSHIVCVYLNTMLFSFPSQALLFQPLTKEEQRRLLPHPGVWITSPRTAPRPP